LFNICVWWEPSLLLAGSLILLLLVKCNFIHFQGGWFVNPPQMCKHVHPLESTGSPQIPKSMNSQAPYIKWHNLCTPSYKF
jgi:hypothetical protein